MHQTITTFVAGRWSVPERSLQVEVLPLRGGLESAVARARITHADGHAAIPGTIVVKLLERGLAREADVYRRLWGHLDGSPALRVLGHERCGDWLASASNGLSGAIRYHLAMLIDPASTDRMRHDSHVALLAWQRVVRRASALLAGSAPSGGASRVRRRPRSSHES